MRLALLLALALSSACPSREPPRPSWPWQAAFERLCDQRGVCL
jgi:hypothetical protein